MFARHFLPPSWWLSALLAMLFLPGAAGAESGLPMPGEALTPTKSEDSSESRATNLNLEKPASLPKAADTLPKADEGKPAAAVTVLPIPEGADPQAAWDKYFAANTPAPAAVRETIRQLLEKGKHEQIIALLWGACGTASRSPGCTKRWPCRCS